MKTGGQRFNNIISDAAFVEKNCGQIWTCVKQNAGDKTCFMFYLTCLNCALSQLCNDWETPSTDDPWRAWRTSLPPEKTALLGFSITPKWAGPPDLWHAPLQDKNPHQLVYNQNTPSRHVWVKDREKVNRQTCISCQGATLQLWLFVLTFIKLSFPAGGPAMNLQASKRFTASGGQCLRTDALALQIHIHRQGHYNPRLKIKKTSF